MVLFIFTLFLMFSLSGVLYLMARALPRVAEVSAAENGATGDAAAGDASRNGSAPMGAGPSSADRKNILDRWLERWARSEIPEKIDGAFNNWLLKFLRKFKVFVLKLDNAVSRHLRKIHHEKNENGKNAAIDFKEISGQNEAVEE